MPANAGAGKGGSLLGGDLEVEWRRVRDKSKLVSRASRVSRECIKRWKRKLIFQIEDVEDEIRGRKRWQIEGKGGDSCHETVEAGGVMGKAPLTASMKEETKLISVLFSPEFLPPLVNS